MVILARLPDARTRGGATVTAWSVPCVRCGRIRTIRRKQHAQRLGLLPCKKCAMPEAHPQENVGGIRASFFHKFRTGARGRQLEWAIDVQYAADLKERQGGACALTGVPLTFDGAYSGIDASLDRIDSTRGYVVGNVQWVHKAINMMKGTLKEPEFVKWCCAVAHKTKW